jgi:hypothetical protein
MKHTLKPSQYAILLTVMLITLTNNPLLSQGQPQKQATTSIPFVGCKADGQVGQLDAPTGTSKSVAIPPQLAQRLAYYQAEDAPAIIAPRGWYCFATYGSNGGTLYVSPVSLNPSDFFSDKWKGFTGPVIQLSGSSGGTSGRFEVAQIIARVFPAHRAFVRKVIAEGIEPAKDFPFGPYPKDKLTYKGREMVEYLTPPQTEGLGTRSRLTKNDEPITGVAAIGGPETDLLILSMRLPSDMADLAPVITQQVEREWTESLQTP